MSLKQELQSEQVTHMDLSGFCQIVSGTSVGDALKQMRKHGYNVCLITKGDDLIGVFTDRDVLRKVAAAPETWNQSIDTVMTSNPITITPESSASEALWLMDDEHFRNLPVVSRDGNVVGNMTHQAVIDFLAARYPVEVLNRPSRPGQFPRQAEGG
jgi:signal-transduction protein with cAMP-binding, CBS, and nucleotidyltransferase domain